jgi:hypothetical protein
MQRVYVLRSEDESCTKIGRGQSPNSRCEAISFAEKKKYYIVYESHSMIDTEALKVECEVINKYKDFRIKGKEWLNIHPLEVIRFIRTLIHTPDNQSESVLLEVNSRFDSWLDANASFKTANEFEEGVKLNCANYISYVKLMYNSRFLTVGFANIGDAKKFARSNKHRIRTIEVITKLLYGLDMKEWHNKQLELKYKAEWRLI